MARPEPSTSEPIGLKARSGLAGFKSSGVHVLDPYLSPPELRNAGAGTSITPGTSTGSGRAHQPAGPGPFAAPAPHGTVWTGQIPADNVGFRLLKKAGWSVGTGLGADEQGIRAPIEPVLPKGTRGLGFDSRAAQQQHHDQGQEQAQSRKRPAAIGEPGGGDGGPRGTARAPSGRSSSSSRVAELVREELTRESLGDKVVRHKQLMRTEREQERGRAIERYLRSAFNDPFDSLRSDNCNPLSRPHKLTESNPLLDPIGD